jgi:signal transduction histidine kinase
MAARASEIGASTLHERLPVTTPGDELGGLATVINDLLDRLEKSFAQQRRFMADASHELRTPAAILRTEADVTLSRATRAEDEYRASLGVMQDASRRLTRIVDDLFLLARADAGHLVVRAENLFLEDVVLDAVRGIRPIADQRAVRVELHDMAEAPVHGDADLLGRLVLNLLDNAVKFSPAGAAVDVDLSRDDASGIVTVTDAGAGIPPDAQARIFERFYRVDAARSRVEASTTSGAGLGLAIARRIAEAHGGALQLVESQPGRTTFRATLPLRSVAI